MGEQTGIVVKGGAVGQKRATNDVRDVGLCLHPTDLSARVGLLLYSTA